MLSLKVRINTLPQELQELILHHLIHDEMPGSIICIAERNYKSPIGLQLNRKLREQFAVDYYSSKEFQVNYKSHRGNLDAIMRWLYILPETHAAHIKRISVIERSARDLDNNLIWPAMLISDFANHVRIIPQLSILPCGIRIRMHTAEGETKWMTAEEADSWC